MIYLFVLLLAVLLWLDVRVFGSVLAPPSLFTAVWTVTLGALALTGNLFYPVSMKTLGVYLFGAMCFTVGGAFCLRSIQKGTVRRTYVISEARHRQCRLILDLLLVICVVSFPWFFHSVLDGVGGIGNPLALLEVRQSAVEATGQAPTFSLLNNLSLLSRLVAFGMFFEDDGSTLRSLRAYASLLPAFAYGILSGSKGPVIITLLTVFFLSWIKSNKLSLRGGLVVLVLCTVSFAAGLLYVNYAYVEFSDSGDKFSRVGTTVLEYWLAGPVAFDRIVRDPNSVASAQRIDSFFLELADTMGGQFEISSRHADFTAVSSEAFDPETNVYTIYFSYYKDYGWGGAACLMAFLGFSLTFLYRSALQGKPVSVLLCAMICVGTVFSFNADHYFLVLNEYAKALLFFGVLYHVPVLTRRGSDAARLLRPEADGGSGDYAIRAW